jgi:hypothetical protein
MPKSRVDAKWNGPLLMAAMHRAIARSEVAWGVNVSMKAKGRAHRISGTLSRSMHCAPGDYDTDDTAIAQAVEMPIIVGQVPRWLSDFISDVAAGSWINYAIFEKRRGGTHDFLSGAVAEANGEFHGQLQQALAEEGWGR